MAYHKGEGRVVDVMTRYEVTDEDGRFLIRGDWQFAPPDLLTDEGPETAVLISLFTDRLAEPDDALPDGVEGNRRGWWADTDAAEGPIGSRLWLLSREVQGETTRLRAIFYTQEALAWMLDDEVADEVNVDAQWTARGRLEVAVDIYRERRLVFSRPFPLVWLAIAEGA